MAKWHLEAKGDKLGFGRQYAATSCGRRISVERVPGSTLSTHRWKIRVGGHPIGVQVHTLKTAKFIAEGAACR